MRQAHCQVGRRFSRSIAAQECGISVSDQRRKNRRRLLGAAAGGICRTGSEPACLQGGQDVAGLGADGDQDDRTFSVGDESIREAFFF